jgi:hypothetical protein
VKDLRISLGGFSFFSVLLDLFVRDSELLRKVVESRYIDAFNLGYGLFLIDQFLLLVGVAGLHFRYYRVLYLNHQEGNIKGER